MSLLTGVLENVRVHFRKAELTLRADVGFGMSAVFKYLDDHRVSYVIRIAGNSVLKEQAEPDLEIVRALS